MITSEKKYNNKKTKKEKAFNFCPFPMHDAMQFYFETTERGHYIPVYANRT